MFVARPQKYKNVMRHAPIRAPQNFAEGKCWKNSALKSRISPAWILKNWLDLYEIDFKIRAAKNSEYKWRWLLQELREKNWLLNDYIFEIFLDPKTVTENDADSYKSCVRKIGG